MSPPAGNLLTLEPLDRMHQALTKQLERGEIKLPLLPKVAGQVIAMTTDPRAEIAQMAALIHRDQALAANVLRIANSAAYMPRSAIVSLQQAVAWLGLNVLAEIALAASLRSGVFNVPGHEAELKELWRHSVASGAYAKEIARIRRQNVEIAYLCGLLHAIGKPVLVNVLSGIERSLRVKVDRVGWAALLDEHHVQVGTMIADLWGLPSQVHGAIASYGLVGEWPVGSPEVLITCLADQLATHLLTPDALSEEALKAHPVFSALNLYPEDVEALLARRESVMNVVESLRL
jgi:putative nucleotidyltransferase with HDIG domain